MADLEGANLSNANLAGSNLRGTSLRAANLSCSNLKGASASADFRGADLSHSSAAGADFAGASFGGTLLDHIQFGPDHPALHDGTDTIAISPRDFWLNWGRLRAIGEFPVFQVSYAALAVSMITITSIGWLNSTRPIVDVLQYPVELPNRTLLLFASSIFLSVGATLYRMTCPKRVQQFSEVQWVEEHGHARLKYFEESFWRRWQIETALITAVGGALALYLVADRVYVALRDVLNALETPLSLGLSAVAVMAGVVLWRPIWTVGYRNFLRARVWSRGPSRPCQRLRAWFREREYRRRILHRFIVTTSRYRSYVELGLFDELAEDTAVTWDDAAERVGLAWHEFENPLLHGPILDRGRELFVELHQAVERHDREGALASIEGIQDLVR